MRFLGVVLAVVSAVCTAYWLGSVSVPFGAVAVLFSVVTAISLEAAKNLLAVRSVEYWQKRNFKRLCVVLACVTALVVVSVFATVQYIQGAYSDHTSPLLKQHVQQQLEQQRQALAGSARLIELDRVSKAKQQRGEELPDLNESIEKTLERLSDVRDRPAYLSQVSILVGVLLDVVALLMLVLDATDRQSKRDSEFFKGRAGHAPEARTTPPQINDRRRPLRILAERLDSGWNPTVRGTMALFQCQYEEAKDLLDALVEAGKIGSEKRSGRVFYTRLTTANNTLTSGCGESLQ
ncbi:hypothetical protein [Microbulbifer epialgicus]|uniref:Preprotein translocase subunit SecY n=1 Tax=Microbulbifer epialgicus TaxID=393907 RepID=A0ABV4P0Z7_9GAMM